MTDDFYALLELPTDASQEEIKEAFRDKVTEYHPDHNDDPRANAQFTALKKAYDTLGDPVERQAYDRLGHKDYVAKRLDGLPSADQWSPARQDDSSTKDSSAGRSSSTATSGTTGTSSSSSSRSTTSGSSSSRTSSSSSRTGTSSTRSSGSSSRSSASSGSTSTSASSTPSASSSSARTSRSATASDGAGTTNPSRARAATASGTSTSGSAGTGSAGSESLIRRLSQYDSVRFLLGWPLVYIATLVYGAGLAGYGVRRQAAVQSYIDGLVAAGTDVDAIVTALGNRGGLDPIGPTIADGLAVVDPVAIVLTLGIVSFPTVLFVLVRLTRISPGWKPTYLYVIVALGPLAGVGYGLATQPLLEVELLLFVGAPLLTLGALLGYAKVRPRIMGLFGD